jgi:ATP-dependent Clp protease adaptor protein ClpS
MTIDRQQVGSFHEDSEAIATHQKVKEPKLYRVLLHNDDFTPMEFVTSLLIGVFGMDEPRAVQVMLDVHEKGVGICGVYPYGVAETKVAIVQQKAGSQEYPLRCSLEWNQ